MKTLKFGDINNSPEVKFCIIRNSPDMCRIIPNDIRSIFKEIADGGCIMSLEVMLSEMEHITNKCAEIGYHAVFEW